MVEKGSQDEPIAILGDASRDLILVDNEILDGEAGSNPTEQPDGENGSRLSTFTLSIAAVSLTSASCLAPTLCRAKRS